MASYVGNDPKVILQARQASYRFVATAGQSNFNGADSNGLTLLVDLKNTQVFLNGVLLDQTDYDLTTTQVHLLSGATVGDIIEVITAPTFYNSDMYNKSEVDQKITYVIGSAGAALDTLGELATALGNDANFASTVTNSLASKANTSTVNTALALKSDISTTVTKDSSTGAAILPVGTTAQRPASPTVGMARWNSTIGAMEYYNGSSWSQQFVLQYAVDYLIVAGGGGGGGSDCGGGGGAGGYVSGTNVLLNGTTTYAITVGGGGAAGDPGASGSNSSITGTSLSLITALGGGGGGKGNVNNTTNGIGQPGGSGGGGGWGARAGGAGTSGQGNNGGQGNGSQSGSTSGGGGGGAGAAGDNNTAPANGGVGLQWLNGSYYAGGGGAGTDTTDSAGGNGGGGRGGKGSPAVTSVAGTANTGGGGGGGRGYSGDGGKAGGSGIVIIRYAGTQRGTGGTVTSVGGYTYHTFTSSGSYTA